MLRLDHEPEGLLPGFAEIAGHPDLPDSPSQEPLGRLAGRLLDRRVREHVAKVPVETGQDVGGVVRQAAHLALTLQQGLFSRPPFGDVGDGAGHRHALARLVGLDQAERRHPAGRPVRPDDPELARIGVVPRDRRADGLEDARAVLLVDELLERVDRPPEAAGWHGIDRVGFARPDHPIGREVPVPHPRPARPDARRSRLSLSLSAVLARSNSAVRSATRRSSSSFNWRSWSSASRRAATSLESARLALSLSRLLRYSSANTATLDRRMVGIDRLVQVIHRAGAVAFEHVLVFAVVGGQEDDRDAGGLLALLDHLGQFEAAHAGHVDIEHEQGEFLGDQRKQRLVGGFGADQAVAGIVQDGFEDGQVLRLVVHEQDVDGLVVRGHRRRCACGLERRPVAACPWHRCLPAMWSCACSYREFDESLASSHLDLPEQPDAHQRQQLLGVHRLGDVVGGAGVQALLAVAFHRLGGQGQDRQRAELGILADLAHGLVAVHLGHHDVHEHHAQVGSVLDQLDGLAAVGGADDFHLVVFEQRGQGEDVAGVVVHHQHLAAAQHLVGVVQPLEHLLLLVGQSATTRCRNSAVSSSSRSGDWTSLRTMLLAIVLSRALLVGGELLAGEDDDRQVVQGRLGLDLLQQLEAGHVGQAQVEHDAVERPVEQRLERLAAGGDGRELDVVVAEQLDDRLPLDVVVLDDQQPLGARGGEVLEAVEGGFEPSVVGA